MNLCICRYTYVYICIPVSHTQVPKTFRFITMLFIHYARLRPYPPSTCPPTQLSSMQDQPVSPPSLPFFVHLLTFLLLLLLLLLGSAVALEVLLVHCVSFE